MKKVALFKMLFIALAVIFSSCDDKDDEIVVDCPEQLSFEFVQEDPNSYIFKADFKDNENFNYEWFINGEFVENPNQINPKGNDLFWEFDKGTHEICITLETPDCPNGVRFCKEIVVDKELTPPTTPKGCPEMDFNRDGDYLFADFEGIKELEFYQWQIGAEVLELEGTKNQGDNKLSLKDLKDGVYEICLWTEGPDCPGVRFCKEVVIGDQPTPKGCPEMDFNRDGDYLFADFEGIEELEFYQWQIGAEVLELEGTKNQGDNKLSLKDLKDGVYEICLWTEGPDCPGVRFCKEVIIGDQPTPPSPEDCPELAFTRDGDYLFADFEGIDNLEWYNWMIDSELVETDGVKSNGDNKLSLQNLESGNYTICITTESATCTLATFCSVIIIE